MNFTNLEKINVLQAEAAVGPKRLTPVISQLERDEESRVTSYPWLQSVFGANLCNLKPCLKNPPTNQLT